MRNDIQVVVLGLGYIGLPTAALIAQQGIKVLGVDIDKKIVNTINERKIHIVEPELDEIVKKSIESGYLKVTSTPHQGNVYIIVVPTPFKKKNEPDISFIEFATKSIIPLLKKNDLYIIESTSPIGTTEKMANFIFLKRPELKDNLFMAYCPERVLPGNILYELIYNDRVIGGINERSAQVAINFYKKFVKGMLHDTNSRTAEMCKLVENSSRDVQIAFANELSMICDKAGIDVWKLIKLANKHPRVNILQPGCGVGGHCIAVDPYFIVSDYPEESKIIGKAREVNNYKSFWVAEKIKTKKLEYQLKYGNNPSVALMGLVFKPNIDDLRESPAKYIVQKVLQDDQDGEYYIVEPNIKNHNVFKLTDYQIAVAKADIICFLVSHNEFRNLEIPKNKKILDFCGITV